MTTALAHYSSSTRPTGPLVIPSAPNRDWRQSSMARPSQSSRGRVPTYVPEGPARGSRTDGPVVERSGGEPVKAGLTFVGVKKEEGEEDVEMKNGDDSEQDQDVKPSSSTLLAATSSSSSSEETLDQKALRALMQMDEEGKPKRQDLVIGMASGDDLTFPVDEGDAFRRDVLNRPEEVSVAWSNRIPRQANSELTRPRHSHPLHLTQSTLDDYASTPIEAFGEALLRGMGWNPSSNTTTAIHAPKRRPAGLGLGATARVEPVAAEGSGSG